MLLYPIVVQFVENDGCGGCQALNANLLVAPIDGQPEVKALRGVAATRRSADLEDRGGWVLVAPFLKMIVGILGGAVGAAVFAVKSFKDRFCSSARPFPSLSARLFPSPADEVAG